MQLHSNKQPKFFSFGGHFLYLTVFAGLLLLVMHYFERELPLVEQWIADLGVLAPLAFMALFAIVAPLFFSVDALCFAAGILFSLPAAIFYVGVATYLAAGLVFLIGRALLHWKLPVFFLNSPRFALLSQAVAGNPFKLMFLLRLTPLPFALLGYVFAMAGVRFKPYLAAVSGFLMQEIVVIYIGYTTEHLSKLLARSQQGVSTATPLVILGFLLVVAIWIYVLKVVHKALQGRIADESDL